ncbi:MAG TPA: hypothetical protein VGF55_17910 [Gemmataceae bacterium]|jgi:hypothetical protein
MEHGLILLIEAILAIDRNLQKPVRAVVPDFPRLRGDPKAALADGEVVIGPRKAYAVATVLGAIVAGVVLVGFALAAMDRPRNQRVEPWYFLAAGIGVLVSGAAATGLVVRWLRGGAAVLRPEGVEFVHRGRSVFCPWGLFQAVGSPYQPDHKRVILPANDGTPVALTDADGNVTARPAAEVKTKPLVGSVEGQVALADLYEVKLAELGELLLHLGRQLGDGRMVLANGAAADPAHAPPATAQPGGWLRVRLTRLPFPPVCVGCGLVTRDAIPHTLDPTHAVRIDVPLCQTCQADRNGRRRRAVLIGLGVGAAPGLLAVLLAAPFLDAEDLFILGALLIPVGVVLGLVGGFVGRELVGPARFKDYAAAAGTVSMRLRPTAGAAAFRRALGVADDAGEPAAVPAAAG